MKLKILLFIECTLLFSLHCASSQPLEINSDWSDSGHLLKDDDPSLNSVQYTNVNERVRERKQNPVISILPHGYSVFSRNNDVLLAYKFNRTKVTWNQARQTCQEEGAYLGYPDSPSEAKKYRHILKRANDGGAWIGLHDLFEEGNWVTVLGQKVDDLKYTNWELTEPNNWGDEGENCAEIYNKDGKWYDTACDKKLFFFCKIVVHY